jgi:hypothetical protein
MGFVADSMAVASLSVRVLLFHSTTTNAIQSKQLRVPQVKHFYFFSLSLPSYVREDMSCTIYFVIMGKKYGQKVSELNQTDCVPNTPFFSVRLTIFKTSEHLLGNFV